LGWSWIDGGFSAIFTRPNTKFRGNRSYKVLLSADSTTEDDRWADGRRCGGSTGRSQRAKDNRPFYPNRDAAGRPAATRRSGKSSFASGADWTAGLSASIISGVFLVLKQTNLLFKKKVLN